MGVFNDILDEAKRCVRCGTCKSVCPVFDVKRKEPSSPRGKMALIEAYFSGEGGLGRAYMEYIKQCTLCGACRLSCPNDVDVLEAILNARREGLETQGMPLLLFLVMKNLLISRRFMKSVMKFASRLQGILFKKSPGEDGFINRFPLPFVGKKRLIPQIAEVFFLDRPHVKALDASGEGDSQESIKVGFYVGCGINYLLPEIGEATIRVLKESNVEVVVPSRQVCCGMPLLSAGDLKAARQLALRNLEVFEKIDADYIVTSCATCGHALKNVFKTLLQDGTREMETRLERFELRSRDITELLKKDLGYRGKARHSQDIVTYHDPCHLARHQGISEEPRALLEESGLRLKEMRDAGFCCGLGGGVSFTDYPLSIEIAKKKAEAISETSSNMVATSCPGCIIQIKDALNRHGVKGGKARVLHVVELL